MVRQIPNLDVIYRIYPTIIFGAVFIWKYFDQIGCGLYYGYSLHTGKMNSSIYQSPPQKNTRNFRDLFLVGLGRSNRPNPNGPNLGKLMGAAVDSAGGLTLPISHIPTLEPPSPSSSSFPSFPFFDVCHNIASSSTPVTNTSHPPPPPQGCRPCRC